jgi:hypothetical protein
VQSLKISVQDRDTSMGEANTFVDRGEAALQYAPVIRSD